MVTVRADWVLVGPDELRGLLKPSAGGNESARDAGQTAAKPSSQEVDPAALDKLWGQTVHYRASVTGFNGQTVHVTSGRGPHRRDRRGADRRHWRRAVRPSDRDRASRRRAPGDAVRHARWQECGARRPQRRERLGNARVPIRGPAPATSQPAAVEEGHLVKAVVRMPPAVDRLNVLAQQLRTTLRVPLGKPVLVGGMTLEPTPKSRDAKQLYLMSR